MIDWGDTPAGSTAYIYWPQVGASTVLQLASQLYTTRLLSTADSHTIQCQPDSLHLAQCNFVLCPGA
jgi:hypothetical protein